jgi:hypothetical protein
LDEGCEVKNRRDIMLLKNLPDALSVLQVLLNNRSSCDEIFMSGREVVYYDDMMPFFQQSFAGMGADISGSAGDTYLHFESSVKIS